MQYLVDAARGCRQGRTFESFDYWKQTASRLAGAGIARTRKLPAAQLTRMSSRPKRPTASRTHRSQSSALRTSPCAWREALREAA